MSEHFYCTMHMRDCISDAGLSQSFIVERLILVASLY